ncbi:calcium/calmodulin-regulated receptor-like kinase 2 [Cucumis sativus]|uniref:Protein kinase domain-containing protein n=1 Tax=Cucumis sativus TaxID=3659 RepID=A0A0A0KSK5_CUCSA|nr:calcium/calmodulin-regulated receptor-like kinase 2 [Cucumis sativus]KGN52533.1 hypothetical protein Csa_008332 [Cucumis sativus]
MSQRADLVIIGISVGLALGILIALLVFYVIRWYRKNVYLRRCTNDRSLGTIQIQTNGLDASTELSASLSGSIDFRGSEKLHKDSWSLWRNHHHKDIVASASGVLKYPYKDIQKATENFTTLLGQGSYGPVYKAKMPNGAVLAVKVLASDSKQGEKEFQTEVSLLGRLHHRNLVNLLGYCIDKGSHMLIYEFMSNGSLDNLLYNSENRVLSWDERIQIALDISHGVEYLHEGAVPPVIHRDLKSANILLDHTLGAKVADFGLSKEEVFDGRNSGLKGTYGYIDPVYMATNKFTMKSDIYSFGIIIFELITAIHPHQNLVDYINLAGMSVDGIDEIIDKQLAGEYSLEEARKLADIGHRCLHNVPRKRPLISEVSQAILKIKQRRLGKASNMSLASMDLSSAVSRIEEQQVELSRIASVV